MFCNNSRRVIEEKFYQLWNNDDDQKVKITRSVMNDDHIWMEDIPDILEPPAYGDEAIEAPAAR
jgi:hypothetical protein